MLTIVGKIPEATVSRVVPVESGVPAGEVAPRLCPGDRVRVALDADTLRHLQQGHGGWNPRMADVSCNLFYFIIDFIKLNENFS